MSGSLPLKAGAPLRKSLVEKATGGHKPLVNSRVMGRSIELALSRIPCTKLQASQRMGYGENQAPISNWITGKEHPQFDKLRMIVGFDEEFIPAYAEVTGCAAIERRVILPTRRAVNE